MVAAPILKLCPEFTPASDKVSWTFDMKRSLVSSRPAIFELEKKTALFSSACHICQNCFYWAQLIVDSTNIDVNSLSELMSLGGFDGLPMGWWYYRQQCLPYLNELLYHELLLMGRLYLP